MNPKNDSQVLAIVSRSGKILDDLILDVEKNTNIEQTNMKKNYVNDSNEEV